MAREIPIPIPFGATGVAVCRARIDPVGDAAERLETVGFGESRPVDSNERLVARNRRVEWARVDETGEGD
jgi:hypothetical protein